MDYKFAGAGTILGGEYENISVSGSSRLDAAVRCKSFKASGALSGTGSIDCTGKVGLSGSASLGGDVSAAELKASGAFKCGGNLRCGMMDASGSIHVGGGMEGDRVTIRGALSCRGLLNAEELHIEMDGVSRVGSIGGSVIRIEQKEFVLESGIRRMLNKAKMREFIVSEGIEGDDIYLENVTAPRVVGRKVTIGPDCRIGLLQYSESAEVSPKAGVEKKEQI